MTSGYYRRASGSSTGVRIKNRKNHKQIIENHTENHIQNCKQNLHSGDNQKQEIFLRNNHKRLNCIYMTVLISAIVLIVIIVIMVSRFMICPLTWQSLAPHRWGNPMQFCVSYIFCVFCEFGDKSRERFKEEEENCLEQTP